MTAAKATAAKNADPAVLKDADIREPLFLYLEERYGKVRFIEEKVTGKARAAVVMVLPDKLCGIEIKSDADTYVRLADQVKYYDKYYDENYIVAGSTHAMHVAKHVPDYWGIITVELIKGRVDFYRMREAQPNPKAKLKQKLSLPKYTNKNKKFIGEKLIEKVPAEVLHEAISEELFERDYTLL